MDSNTQSRDEKSRLTHKIAGLPKIFEIAEE